MASDKYINRFSRCWPFFNFLFSFAGKSVERRTVKETGNILVAATDDALKSLQKYQLNKSILYYLLVTCTCPYAASSSFFLS